MVCVSTVSVCEIAERVCALPASVSLILLLFSYLCRLNYLCFE